MRKTRFIALFLVLSLLTLSIPAFAKSDDNSSSKASTLTAEEISKYESYVSLDKKTDNFIIDKKAKKALSKEEYQELNDVIINTNSIIDSIDTSSSEVFIIDPEESVSTSDSMSTFATFNEGVTKIEFYWWGARVYLSKTTLNTVGGGIAIGGIWFPEPLVSKILATVGAVAGVAPGGIVFDYNFLLGMIPVVSSLALVSSIHFQ